MMHYPIVIHKDPDTDYSVAVPDLPGCVTAGDTLEEALEMAKEAIELHVEGMLADGEALPEPRGIDEHWSNSEYEGGTWALVEIDPAAILADAQRRLTWRFVVGLGETDLSEDLAEALHEAGCDDGIPRVTGGAVEVAFERQAHCLEEALRGAIADVQKAGCRAAWVRIDPEDLVLAVPAGQAVRH